MLPLAQKDYYLIELFLKSNLHVPFPLINAVIDKSQFGKIFVDSLENINTIYVINKIGFSQLFCTKNSNLYDFCLFIKNSKEIPDYIHIYDSHVDLDSIFNKIELATKNRIRTQFRYNSKKNIISDKIHPNFSIKNIDQINFNDLDVFKLDLENRFWNSKKDFLENSYALCIVNNKFEPISICYSACVSNNISEVDIATLENYRGNKLGKILTEHFINNLISKNIKTNWDCFNDNIPSFKIASDLGFEKIKEYNFLSIYNKGKYEEKRI
ncbi:MAG: GNAT family N-acetyltransferase [Cyanobacteriota bacterium]